MKIVTAAELREIDRITTERFGIPSLTLMENAGSAVGVCSFSVSAGEKLRRDLRQGQQRRRRPRGCAQAARGGQRNASAPACRSQGVAWRRRGKLRKAAGETCDREIVRRSRICVRTVDL